MLSGSDGTVLGQERGSEVRWKKIEFLALQLIFWRPFVQSFDFLGSMSLPPVKWGQSFLCSFTGIAELED